jgi:hypothetical protein
VAGTQKIDPRTVAELGSALRENIQRAVKARDEAVRDLQVALLAETH